MDVIVDYFRRIFTSNSPSREDMDSILDFVEPNISAAMNVILEAPFSKEDVKTALFGMGSTKSPGPDGFHALFFQRNWDIMGEICRRCVWEF